MRGALRILAGRPSPSSPVSRRRAAAKTGIPTEGRRRHGREALRGSRVPEHRSLPRRPRRRPSRASAGQPLVLLPGRDAAAGSGRRSTAARTGSRCRTRTSRPGSVGAHRGRRIRPERHLRRAWARRRSAATSRTATASTSRPTPARRGGTWASADTRQIARVRVHPTEPDLVYVAALGHVWGPNPERGIYRSKDGGKTWDEGALRQRQDRARRTSSMDPTNPRILYAGFWQVHRKPWALVSGGPEGGIWKTTDGGDTWKKLAGRACPRGSSARSAWPSRRRGPERVWAIVESKDEGRRLSLRRRRREVDARQLARTSSASAPGTTRGSTPTRRTPDTVYVLNVGFYRSNDGGKTFNVDPRAARRQPRPLDRSGRSAAG